MTKIMKGILFTEGNFIATIEGTKTQTRRIIEKYAAEKERDFYVDYARYKVGEKVFLKEPYKLTVRVANIVEINFLYSNTTMCADILSHYTEKQSVEWLNKRNAEQNKSKSGFCNKMFMLEWLARYFIEITGVGVERLQDISDEDCIKEGIFKINNVSSYRTWVYPDSSDVGHGLAYHTPQQAYAAQIESLNKGAWERNDYVFVYDYKLLKSTDNG